MLKPILYTFALSMVPIVELRGALILGFGLSLPWYVNLPICILGNMLPIPFILLFIRRILNWMKNVKCLDKIALWVEKVGQKRSGKVTKYELLGLFLFVAIPLPGTGAWMGALISSLLEMRIKHSLISIFLGVICAGTLITVALYGAGGLASLLLL